MVVKFYLAPRIRTSTLILGSSEDDMLTGSKKSDDIHRGESNDILDGGPRPDLFYGGAGIDTVSYPRSDAGVALRLVYDGASAPATGGHAEGDIFYGIENLKRSRSEDVLVGNEDPNRYTGGDGRDIFSIDLVASHITKADVIMDFSGRNADGLTVKDDHDKIQLLALSGHRFLFFLAAGLISDNSGVKDDWFFITTRMVAMIVCYSLFVVMIPETLIFSRTTLILFKTMKPKISRPWRFSDERSD